MVNVAIIGAGRMGSTRALAAREFPYSRVVAVADVNPYRALRLARRCKAQAVRGWEDLLPRRDIKAVIVATPHQFLAPISLAFLEHGKHVLCEKPMAVNRKEARALVRTAQRKNLILKTGFNHRYYPAIQKARELVNSGRIGELFFIRARYGHGGRVGYDREWRANRELAGGGQLMDQGIHLLDLFRWFLGDFREAFGHLATYFWDMKPLEDNVFALFRTRKGQIASLHASYTQWKNLFSFEICGEKGDIQVEGLGRSYGRQRLRLCLRSARAWAPKIKNYIFSNTGGVWTKEWEEFISSVRNGIRAGADGSDGLKAIEMLEAVYRSSRLHRSIPIGVNHA